MKFGKKICIILLTILLGGGMLLSSLSTDHYIYAEDVLPVEYNDVSYATLVDAIDAVPNDSEATIYLTNDFTISSRIILGENKTITLVAKDKDITIELGKSGFILLGSSTTGYGQLIVGESENTITIDGTKGSEFVSMSKNADSLLMLNRNVIIQNFTDSIVTSAYNSRGILTINGAIVQNCKTTNELFYIGRDTVFNMDSGKIINNQAPIINIVDGQLNMNGGEISNNTSKTPIIYSDGFKAFVMTDGKISNNTVTAPSGSGFPMGTIRLQGSTAGQSMTMSGGEISNNHSNKDGGAIYLMGTSVLNMTGGTISGNTAAGNGGGICAAQNINDSNIKVNMIGGTISENTAKNGGGIYAGFTESTKNVKIQVSGGVIKNNQVSGYGGGIYIRSGASNSQLIIYDKPYIKDNIAPNDHGKNVYLNLNSNILIKGKLGLGTEISVDSEDKNENDIVTESVSPYSATLSDILEIKYEYEHYRITLNGTNGILKSETRNSLHFNGKINEDLYTGQKYSDKKISAMVYDPSNNEVNGTWEYLEDSKVTEVGVKQVNVRFIPDDIDSYKPLESKINFTIKKADYSVEHYIEDKDGNYQLSSTETKSGDIGDEVTITPKGMTGYHHYNAHSDTLLKGKLEMDGSRLKELKLKLYYNLNEYDIDYKDEENILSQQTNKYNQQLVKPDVPTKDGYTFVGWYKDKVFNEEWDFDKDVVTEDLSLYAKWLKHGQITTQVDTDSESSNIQIDMTQDELIDAVLTPEQQSSIHTGTNIEITVKVQPAEITESLQKQLKESVKGYTLGQNLDIRVWLKINETVSQINETEKPIQIKIEIPEELRSKGKDFVLVRIHNGVVTLLNDMDSDDNTITILSNQFSDYVLMYKAKDTEVIVPEQPNDKPVSPEQPETKPTVPLLPQQPEKKPEIYQPTTNVKTADESMIDIFLVILLVSSLGILSLVSLKRKTEK